MNVQGLLSQSAPRINKRVITIKNWISLNYDVECAPTILTVRRWIREGRIYPLPDKRGRTYYLEPIARYFVEKRAKTNEDSAGAPEAQQRPQEHAAAIRKAKTAALSNARSRSSRFFGVEGLSRTEFEYIWHRSGGRCELSGIEFDCFQIEGALKRPWVPSIDRIDSAKGYTADNCRVVCLAVNLAMNEWGEKVLFRIAEAITQRKLDSDGSRTERGA